MSMGGRVRRQLDRWHVDARHALTMTFVHRFGTGSPTSMFR